MGLDQAANFAPIRNLRNPILIKHLFGFLGPFLNLKHQKAVFPKVERTWPQGPPISPVRWKDYSIGFQDLQQKLLGHLT